MAPGSRWQALGVYKNETSIPHRDSGDCLSAPRSIRRSFLKTLELHQLSRARDRCAFGPETGHAVHLLDSSQSEGYRHIRIEGAIRG